MRSFDLPEVVEFGALGLLGLLMLGTILNMALNVPASMNKEFTTKIFRIEVYTSPTLNSTKIFTYGEGSYVFDGDLSHVIKEGLTYRFVITRRPRAILLELEEVLS